MSHQWAQFDPHDTSAFKLTDDEQKALIKAWQQSGSFKPSFDDVIIEAQQTQNTK